MPEQFTLGKTFADGAAMDGNKSESPALLIECMDTLRKQLLSCSGLSLD